MKSIEKMDRSIVNAQNLEFPRTWTVNSLIKHKKIYFLMKEYEEIALDYNKSDSSKTKNILEKRLKEIEEELVRNYFIVHRDEMFSSQR